MDWKEDGKTGSIKSHSLLVTETPGRGDNASLLPPGDPAGPKARHVETEVIEYALTLHTWLPMDCKPKHGCQLTVNQSTAANGL